MMHPEISKIVTIAREAGKKILEVYNNEELFSTTFIKEDKSPLTLADKASHQVIKKGLMDLYPEIPVVSEENEEKMDLRSISRYWLVDPLDGTKEFIKRNGEFTVNIALIVDHYPVMGVVYVPVGDMMYYAEIGKGAFSEKDGTSFKIHCNAFNENDKGLRLVSSRSHMSEETKAFVQKYSEPDLVSKGSSLKFMLVAEGNADIYPRLAPTMHWDTAAAQIVVEEAGGSVVDYRTGERFGYFSEDLLNGWFVVFGKRK